VRRFQEDVREKVPGNHTSTCATNLPVGAVERDRVDADVFAAIHLSHFTRHQGHAGVWLAVSQ